MALMARIEGAKAVRTNLKEFTKQEGQRFRRNLIRAGLFLQRESQQIVPIDTAALKNSAGTRPLGQGWKTDVVVFYTQAYAIYVHERTDIPHKPGKSAKFLTIPMREKRSVLLKIIAGAGA